MRASSLVMLSVLCSLAASGAQKALIVDGQNNHQWQLTTPVLKRLLEDTGLFQVDVATSPPRGADMSGFKPPFKAYTVVISNYSDYNNGGKWPPETQKAFEDYVKNGGGFVSVHAADNAFPDWLEYNRMIGIGGWSGRDEKSGPYVRWKDGKFVRDMKPGKGGHHGQQHEFQVTARDKNHPITRGLPEVWKHAKDELYDSLRGPAENMNVLATAWSDPATGGTGEHEPALIVLGYGKGRVFHTTLGHGVDAMKCVGFIVTFQRGTEWAATGKVTQKAPSDFPTAQQVSVKQ